MQGGMLLSCPFNCASVCWLMVSLTLVASPFVVLFMASKPSDVVLADSVAARIPARTRYSFTTGQEAAHNSWSRGCFGLAIEYFD